MQKNMCLRVMEKDVEFQENRKSRMYTWKKSHNYS